MFAGIDEMMLLGDGTHLGLVQGPQRQAHMSQLLLGEVVQHIALILALIQPLFEQPAAGVRVLFHPGIVAGDHIFHAVILGFVPGSHLLSPHGTQFPVDQHLAALDHQFRLAARLHGAAQFQQGVQPDKFTVNGNNLSFHWISTSLAAPGTGRNPLPGARLSWGTAPR